MVKNIVIVVLSLVLLACLYGGVYRWVTADAAQAMQSDHPELEWLRREYSLSDSQFTEIRAKHEAHDIVCRELCRDLVRVQKNLDSAISTYSEMSEEVREALSEWTEQRKRCREAALLHMYDVSAAMDEDSASRYREKTFRQIVVLGKMPHIGPNGEFHEESVEHATPDSSASTTSDNE